MRLTTKQLIVKLESYPKGINYLEKGEIQKELCKRFKLDYQNVKTAVFEAALRKAKGQ